MKNIKPIFQEDIAMQLRTIYLSTLHRGIGAAWVVFLLCSVNDIDPSTFMKPEHIQEIQREIR